MEYDRALYRIYERLLDDLGGAESIFVPEAGEDSIGQNDRIIPFLLPISLLRFINGVGRNGLKQSIRSICDLKTLQRYFRTSIQYLGSRIYSQRFHDHTEDELQTLTTASSIELTSVVESRTRVTGLRRRFHSVSFQSNGSSVDYGNQDIEANASTENPPDPNTALSQIEIRRRQSQNVHDYGGCNQRAMYIFMHLTFWFAIFHLLVLFTLHYTYVGPRLFKKIPSVKDRRMLSSMSFKQTCLESALSSRPEYERSRFYATTEEQSSVEVHKDTKFPFNKNDMQFVANSTSDDAAPPLLGRDEILLIKIIYGNQYHGRECSRVRTVQPAILETNGTHSVKNWKLWSHLWPIFQERKDEDVSHNCTSTDSYFTSEQFWKEPHYKFSTNEALMFLDDNMLNYHNVSIVNVTLTEQCLSTGHDLGSYSVISSGAEFLSGIYGMDTIIMNQVMFGIRTSEDDFRNGYLHNLESNERWSYSRSQMKHDLERNHSILKWLINRCSVLLVSALAFSLVTTLTALVIRVLTTSGVMLFFPLFSCFRRFGVPGVNDRLLEYSYPWIGVARSVIRREGTYPVKYFIWAHLGKLFLVYTMYESCQYGFSSFLYGKSIPQNLPIWTFGFAMILEYYSMIFVRSAIR